MNKKIFAQAILAVFVVQLFFCVPVSAVNVSVYINGKALPSDAQPISVKGRVMIPLRIVAESLNAKVYWFADDNRIEVRKGFRSTMIWVAKEPFVRNYAVINGKYQTMDVLPKIVKGKSYVPLRMIGEALGADVQWDDLTKTVVIELAEPEKLAGKSARVRDALYGTLTAKTLKFKTQGQLKLPEYPQVNIFSIDGSYDRKTNMYLNGQAAGWSGEALYLDKRIYLKSVLFNDQWVELKEVVDSSKVEEIQRQKSSVEEQLKDLSYDCTTELVRALGLPVDNGEETINGVLCRKTTFVPNGDSQKALLELKSAWGDVDKISLTLWIGAGDRLVHKSDLRAEFTTLRDKTGAVSKGFIQCVTEFTDIDHQFNVKKPSDFDL